MQKHIVAIVLLCSTFAVRGFAANESADTANVAMESEVQKTLATVEAVQVKAKNSEAKSEDQIPLNLDTHKKSAETESSLFRLLFSVSILGILGAGAFVLIRRKTIPGQKKHQTQIKVLQQHFLGPKKSLAIVRVAGESILIGITDQNISHIKTLSLLDDELPQEVPNNFASVVKGLGVDADFSEAPKQRASNNQESQEDEEFSFGGIRDVVSRKLRNMRNFE